ncbi:uncharacterized protein LOC142046437 [Chelonoidis abingdonii]|uniref:uncharacterized protein LOC142046437 n=1 Tax=Chelonoidis abingdonii TaxID=106734 RepID=UPI003F4915B9
MGNVLGRPSCLGDKSQKPEEFLKNVGLGPEQPVGRNNRDARAGAPDKSPLNPVVIENGWTLSPGSAKSQSSSPLPKQNNMEVKVQNRSRGCSPLKAQLEATGATWTPPRGAPHRDSGSSWAWKPVSTREVTEVTEVTETIVTEIVEVTEYPGGEPVVTQTVKVLTECDGERTEVNNGGQPLGSPQAGAGVAAGLCRGLAAQELFVCGVHPSRPGVLAFIRRWLSAEAVVMVREFSASLSLLLCKAGSRESESLGPGPGDVKQLFCD